MKFHLHPFSLVLSYSAAVVIVSDIADQVNDSLKDGVSIIFGHKNMYQDFLSSYCQPQSSVTQILKHRQNKTVKYLDRLTLISEKTFSFQTMYFNNFGFNTTIRSTFKV